MIIIPLSANSRWRIADDILIGLIGSLSPMTHHRRHQRPNPNQALIKAYLSL